MSLEDPVDLERIHIHQIYFSNTKELMPKFNFWRKTWLEKFPKSYYHLWDEKKLLNTSENLWPQYLPLYQNLHHPMQKINFWKYLLLYQIGGMVIDLDLRCDKNIIELLKEKHKDGQFGSVHLFQQKKIFPSFKPKRSKSVEDDVKILFSKERITPSIMISFPKNHPFWSFVLRELVITSTEPKWEFETDENYVHRTCGYIMLQKAYCSYIRDNIQSVIDDIKIHPSKNIFYSPIASSIMKSIGVGQNLHPTPHKDYAITDNQVHMWGKTYPKMAIILAISSIVLAVVGLGIYYAKYVNTRFDKRIALRTKKQQQ